MARHRTRVKVPPNPPTPEKSDTPESRREIQDDFEDASAASRAAALVAASVALAKAAIRTRLAAVALAIEAVSLALDKLARDHGRAAETLEKDLQNRPSSPAPPEATPNMDPGSPDSLLGPGPMIGASLAPVQGASHLNRIRVSHG